MQQQKKQARSLMCKKFQLLVWNLPWFQLHHKYQIKLIITENIISLACLLMDWEIEVIKEISRRRKIPKTRNQSCWANGHERNKWFVVSSHAPQWSHLEVINIPVFFNLSSVGTLSWRNLQKRNDLDGGIAGCHKSLLQTTGDCLGPIKS